MNKTGSFAAGRTRNLRRIFKGLMAPLGAALLLAQATANAENGMEKKAPDRRPAPAVRVAAPLLPVHRIALRVHLGGSGRSAAAFLPILREINGIWLTQAGICFEMQVLMNDEKLTSGFDMWFTPRVYGNDDWNGVFTNEHEITVRDTPRLNPAPSPARHPAARTAAHEIGHALGLPHRQDSDDNLMRSKTYGWHLNADEVTRARNAARQMALPDHGERGCGQVRGEE